VYGRLISCGAQLYLFFLVKGEGRIRFVEVDYIFLSGFVPIVVVTVLVVCPKVCSGSVYRVVSRGNELCC